MGMYNLIADNVDKFYTLAENKIGECECFSEFANSMQTHLQLLAGSSDSDCWEEALYELWQEKWAR